MFSYLSILSDIPSIEFVAYPAAAVLVFGVSMLVKFLIYGGKI